MPESSSRSRRWPRVGLACWLLIASWLVACSGSGGEGGSAVVGGGDLDLIDVSFGRLVDVYGFVEEEGVMQMELYRADVVIGTDIVDERPPGSGASDEEILYDFLASDPDSLQPRLLITREIGSSTFEAAFERLGLRIVPVSPAVFGQDSATLPFSVVGRNAAIQLTFSDRLPVDQSFFVEPSPIDGLFDVKNTTAVQLLAIRGDPRDSNPVGDFEQIPARVIVRGDRLILDPVLLGTEGSKYLLRSNASGLPASPNQDGANIRIALALEGPLRMPGLRERHPEFIGTNNAGDRSIIRDFRSGNELDSSVAIVRGFIRDAEPLRILGEMLMYVSSVRRVNVATHEVEIYKAGIAHEIDDGDLFRFVERDGGEVLGVVDVITKPTDDLGNPAAQWVRVLVRDVEGFDEADGGSGSRDWMDDPDRPNDRDELGPWLEDNAPQAVLIAEFTASRRHPETGDLYGDDPVNFISFSPGPLPDSEGRRGPANQNISPFAEALIRFSKPVDLATVRAFDSFFFSTRDVLDQETIEADFLLPNGMDPEAFDWDKFRTPHLVASRIIDNDGSQTTLRLQPDKGFFLNDEMRQVDEGVPFEDKAFRYFMNVLGGAGGVRDLAGNPIDFRSPEVVVDSLVVPFSLDTRPKRFADNLSVSIVRRFAAVDEDEQPSYYMPAERDGLDPDTGFLSPPRPEAYRLQDLFGAVTYLNDGRLQARTTARVTKVVDNLNQQSPPPQDSDLRFCPNAGAEETVASPSASVAFGQGIQNPLNPYGARLQTVWREIDMSLSRVDPLDFNLDVEQMYWAPFRGGAITFDQFDRTSLFLGHSESRPEPCIGVTSAMPVLPGSGLQQFFADNYANNPSVKSFVVKELSPPPHPAYVDQALTIDAARTLTEPNGLNRFLPLPEFQQPYFVWRDETVAVQGGQNGASSDTSTTGYAPYIISPWMSGNGRLVTQLIPGEPFKFTFGRHENASNRLLVDEGVNIGYSEAFTGGSCPSIALPLLADFWTYCDDPDLPEGNGFVASGFNGWQIALAAQSSPTPNFRAYSGGFSGSASRSSICVDEGSPGWSRALGGFLPNGTKTPRDSDNSVYWVMADFLKRQTVVTAGFVDIFNPHRMPERQLLEGDPRLGPYLLDGNGESQLPSNVLPRYSWLSEPPLDSLPAGTAVVPEFRAAGRMDEEQWRFYRVGQPQLYWSEAPDEINFPLDPLKACDAGIRKYDQRSLPETGRERAYWTYYYNRHVTDYSRDIADLSRSAFTTQFTSPSERFNAGDVRYFNWRFIMRNNVTANPPVSPEIDSFAVSYRFESQ